MKVPRAKRIVYVDRCKPKKAVSRADQFRLLVANQVDQLRRLVRHPIKHLMLLPMRAEPIPFGILVDIRGRAGKTDHEHVVPAVTIEVMHPGKKVVRIAIHILRHRLIDFVLRFGSSGPANQYGP